MIDFRKCKKFVLGAKKSAVGDKPAARQPMATVALDLGGIPNALTPVIDMRGFMAQMAAVSTLWLLCSEARDNF